MTDIQYTELPSDVRQQMITTRLRDLEQQHLNLALRVNAPDPASAGVTESEQQNLTMLESSIEWCRSKLNDLQPPASPSAPTS